MNDNEVNNIEDFISKMKAFRELDKEKRCSLSSLYSYKSYYEWFLCNSPDGLMALIVNEQDKEFNEIIKRIKIMKRTKSVRIVHKQMKISLKNLNQAWEKIIKQDVILY